MSFGEHTCYKDTQAQRIVVKICVFASASFDCKENDV